MVELRVLGSMSLVHDDGRAISAVMAQPKRFALLAYLGASPKGSQHQRDSIVGLLWSEMPEARARAALSKAVHFLRHYLGNEVLVAQGDGALGVDSAHLSCDARRFDDACAAGEWELAVELYRGPFLEGLFVSEAPGFEHWLDQERDRRRRAFSRALDSIAMRHESEGAIARAVEVRQRLVAHEPQDSRAVRMLMEVLARSGNPAGALRVAAEHESLLQRELAVAPDPSVSDLVRRLRVAPPDGNGRQASSPQEGVTARESADRPSGSGAQASSGRTSTGSELTRTGSELGPAEPHPSGRTSTGSEQGPAEPHPIDVQVATRTAAPAPAPFPRPRRRWPALLTVALLLGVSAAAWRGSRWWPQPAFATDSTRIAVVPFAIESLVGDSLDPATAIHDSLSTWTGITTADLADVRRAISQSKAPPRSVEDAAGIARIVRARRFFWGEVSTAGDSLRVDVRIGDTESRLPIEDRVVTVPRTRAGVASLARLVPDFLVGEGPSATTIVLDGTRNLPALRAYVAGRQAMDSWDLGAAAGAFKGAAAGDPKFASAQLWSALVQDWSGAEGARYRVPAEQAQLHQSRLAPDERIMSQAVLAEARGELGAACDTWGLMTKADSLSVAAWYGASHCERMDETVVADRRSPSGWRYRSSIDHALRGFQRAFRLQPAILFAFRQSSFEPLRTLFVAGGNYYRNGQGAPPGRQSFSSRISMSGDTVVMIPWPGAASEYPSREGLDGFAAAVTRQRRLVRDVASTWVSAYPDNADAWHALAISLAMLGDPNAPDTLAVARRNSHAVDQQLQLALADVWMQLGLGVSRRETAVVARARTLADSLLKAERPGTTTQPLQLSALAALTGRATLAAQFARRPEVAQSYHAAPPLVGVAVPLLVYSLFDAPADSVAELEQRVSAAIEHLPVQDRAQARLEWLARAATLCYPVCRMHTRDSLVHAGDALLDAQADRDSGHVDAVKRLFATLAAARAGLPPDIISLDALAPEAELLAAIGEDRAAARWLDPTLLHVSEIAPEILGTPERTGALVRSMLLRARVAERLGDRGSARRWMSFVQILWSSADQAVRRDLPVIAPEPLPRH